MMDVLAPCMAARGTFVAIRLSTPLLRPLISPARRPITDASAKGMRSMTHSVFVYGTLKSGFSNHYLLKGCKFFGAAVTVPTYKMIENGFPVIMPDPEGKPLAGEIYTVDDETLARLDQLEREGSSYDRKLIDVNLRLASGERAPTKAFIYIGREDRFGKAFAHRPLLETVNERGELYWKAGA